MINKMNIFLEIQAKRRIANKINIHKFIGVLGFIIFCLWFVYAYYYGEYTQHNNGLGWDGVLYAKLAQQNIINIVFSKSISGYYIQRLLPSLLVHLGAKIVNFNIMSNIGVLHAFEFYNDVLIILSAFFLWLISKHLKWKLRTFFIGFSGIFFSYSILKFSVYFPTLTDTTAFFLGIAIYYFYLKDNLLFLLICIFAGAFTYPSFFYASIPFILFKEHNDKGDISFSIKHTKVIDHIATVIGIAIVFFALCLYYFKNPLTNYSSMNQVNRLLLPISAASVFLYFLWSFRYLMKQLPNIKIHFYFVRLLIMLMLFIVIRGLIFYFSSSTIKDPLTIFSYFTLITQLSMVNPFTSFVSHVMNFGPIIVILILIWPNVSGYVAKKGVGLFSFVCLYLLLGIDSESRHLINAMPIFVILVCEVLNTKPISWFFTYSFAMLSLIFSHFWLTLNRATLTGNLLGFPDQLCFMSQGPWMCDTMYLVFLSIVIILLICMYSMLKLENNQQNNF